MIKTTDRRGLTVPTAMLFSAIIFENRGATAERPDPLRLSYLIKSLRSKTTNTIIHIQHFSLFFLIIFLFRYVRGVFLPLQGECAIRGCECGFCCHCRVNGVLIPNGARLEAVRAVFLSHCKVGRFGR